MVPKSQLGPSPSPSPSVVVAVGVRQGGGIFPAEDIAEMANNNDWI